MGFVYSEKVKDHFLNPRGMLFGEVDGGEYDGVGTVGNVRCGDEMRVYIRVGRGGGAADGGDGELILTEVKWQTYGCASAIASTSALSEIATGKTLEEALAITAEEIADYLGGMSKHKFHCSVLGQEALTKAIENLTRKP